MKKEIKVLLKEEINQRIKSLESRITINKKKLDEDFTYYFSWVCEELYMDEYKLKYYKRTITLESDIEEVLMEHAKQLYRFCIEPTNVRENSTGSLHREASTYKFQCNLELLNDINKMLNYK